MSISIAAGCLSILILITLMMALGRQKVQSGRFELFFYGVLVLLPAVALSVYAAAVAGDVTADEAVGRLPRMVLGLAFILYSTSLGIYSIYLKSMFDVSRGGAEDWIFRVPHILCIAADLLLCLAGMPRQYYGFIILLQGVTLWILLLIHLRQLEDKLWLPLSLLYPLAAALVYMWVPALHLFGAALMLMYFTVYMNYQAAMERKFLEQKLELADSRISLLIQQISPHFIFNSLQVIRGLTGKDAEAAASAIDHFSAYLRGNLEAMTNTELIPFMQELEYAKEYIELEHFARGDSFVVEYELDVEDFLVPALSLQPLVENALRYGIGTREYGGRIVIATKESEEAYLITVANDGKGRDLATERQKKRQSVGLANVRSRLEAQCGGRLEIDKNTLGTEVSIIIPKNFGGGITGVGKNN